MNLKETPCPDGVRKSDLGHVMWVQSGKDDGNHGVSSFHHYRFSILQVFKVN